MRGGRAGGPGRAGGQRSCESTSYTASSMRTRRVGDLVVLVVIDDGSGAVCNGMSPGCAPLSSTTHCTVARHGKRTSARTTIGSARRRLRQAQDVVRGDRALELGVRVAAIARPLTASVGPALVCLLRGGLGWALPSPGAHKHLLVSTRSEADARAMITAGASQQERSPGQSCKARSGGPAAGKAVRTARQVSHRNRRHRRPRFRRRPRLRRRRCFHSQCGQRGSSHSSGRD